MGAATPHLTPTTERPAVPVERRDADQRRDLFAIEAPQFGDLREQGSRRHRPDAGIREALGEAWQEALAPYKPEPFSGFDVSGELSEEDGCLLCARYSRPLAHFVSEQPGSTNLPQASAERP
jgi:hypothetical protein